MTYAPCGTIFRAVLLLILFAVTPFAAEADELKMDAQTREVVERIKAVEASLRTFEAKFRQIQKSRMFEQVVESQGVIYFSADDKLNFSVHSPSPLTVLLNGEWFSIIDPESGRIKRRHIGERQSVLKNFFGVGQSMEELQSRFDVKAVSNKPLPGVTLTMVPKKSLLAKKVRQITATVDDTTWLPQQVVIQQSETEWSRLDLEFVHINGVLPDHVFTPAASHGTPPSKAAGQAP